MHPLIMKAIIDGATILIGSIFTTAAKKGFAIMLLVGVVVALVWMGNNAVKKHAAEVVVLKGEVRDIREELKQCNADRALLAVEVAKLKTRFELFTKQKK